MSQTTQIELKPKDFIFLVKSLGIQFTPQLFFSGVYTEQVRAIQTKYEVKNPKGK